MKVNDYVKITGGSHKGEYGTITGVGSCPDGIMYQIDNSFWIDGYNAAIQESSVVKIKYFNPNCKVEQHGDWIDVKAASTIHYKSGDFIMIPLGFAMQLPKNCEGHLLPRSSTFKKYHIIMTNSMGIIDEAYCGDNDQWHFPALAFADGVVREGDRIAQFRIVKKQKPLSISVVDCLHNADRGGFGSTGR